MTVELEAMLEIARRAATIISEVYAQPFDVDYKGPRDPVTEADRRANDFICAQLEQRFAGVPIVAEESPPESYADYRQAERVFFVDPLDGTREFVKRNGEFVVMIGLLDGDRPRAGVLFAPARGEAWAGGDGVAAFYAAPSGERTSLGVSPVAELGQARVVSTRSHRSEALVRALAALGAMQVDALGSAGLKCAEVAAGRAEAYVAPGWAGSRWDLCAGEAIIVAAGGRVTDAFGVPIDYRAPDLGNSTGVVASNGRVHDQILAQLAQARETG